ncbi:hypothetical protein HAZT_HAZT010703 [Hyalella azteca]|uniref:Endonuclease/exonuclease/phosphatase domain-containing protein n=1 Tax=Hyalella azteca TaxID=294128 RepID=A0A6A0H7N0_HYAAZ|nr:hypothetical protein HAZT_HAZT010703 [Hyalella azteca]
MNKRDEIQALIETHQPAVLGITEVKPKNNRFTIEECEVAYKGYEIFHNLGKPGRGIALYVKSDLKPSVCDSLDSDFAESVFVECRLSGNEQLLIGLIYRSPSSTADNTAKLNKLLQQAADLKPSHLLIMGDFNFPELDWNTEKSEAGPAHPATVFLRATKDAFLLQHQKLPTRYRVGQKANVLDLVFTNRDDMINDVTTTAGVGKSDHFLLIINVNCDYDVAPRQARYNYKKTDFTVLTQELEMVDWVTELTELSVNDVWLRIKEHLHGAVEKSTPKSSTSGRRGKSWMDTSTLASVRKKHQLFRRWLQTRVGADYQAYIKARNQARKKCRTAQKKQEESVARESKRNPKAFWAFVKSKTKTRSGVADLKKPDGTKTSNDLEKAELLNSFFQSVFTKVDPGPLPPPPSVPHEQTLENFVIEEEDVRKVLANLKVDKAPGPDGISPLSLAKYRMTGGKQ